MHATVHALDGVPGPQDDSWVDAVLTALRARAVPVGALVARPLGLGAGAVVALWEVAVAAADAGSGPAGPVTLGPGVPYRVGTHLVGRSAGPARYLQLTSFAARGEGWGERFDRAGEERITPAVRDLPGLVASLGCAGPDGARVSATLTDSLEELHAGTAAILSTTLLPWEDRADLVGPDGLEVLRLVHADVPAGADR